MNIFDAQEGQVEKDKLSLLLELIKDFEDRHIALPVLDLLEAVKLKVEENGIQAKDIEPILRTLEVVS